MFRYDIPGSDWAVGSAASYQDNNFSFRLTEISEQTEGPVFANVYVENKDVFGLTVNLNVFNLSAGQSFFDRIVYTGLRDRSPVAFTEHRRLHVSSIWRLQVRGSF